MKRSFLSLAVAAVVLSGCSLIPDYQRPEAPVAAAYPQGQAYPGFLMRPAGVAGEASVYQ
ncbi:lipoprotein, partial [Pseudomonas aeruginosa]|nr:lipoprotein [Pseudomonas aeruginosa]